MIGMPPFLPDGAAQLLFALTLIPVAARFWASHAGPLAIGLVWAAMLALRSTMPQLAIVLLIAAGFIGAVERDRPAAIPVLTGAATGWAYVAAYVGQLHVLAAILIAGTAIAVDTAVNANLIPQHTHLRVKDAR